MSIHRAVITLLACGATSVSLSLSLSALAGETEPPVTTAQVVWEERPESVDALASDALVTVEARVTAILEGPSLVSPNPQDDSTHGIPTQRVQFETVHILDGAIADTFRVFKTGSDHVVLAGDPLYEVGETYVLFLEPQGEPGTYLPVAPDGRLEVGADGAVDPVIEGPVGSELEGMTPEQIEDAAQ